MEKITDFPALEDRKAYLEHALYTAMQQTNDATQVGKAEIGTEEWLKRIRQELRELRYVLAMLTERNSRIDISWKTVVVVGAIVGLVIAIQIAVLWWMGANH